ncbi:MAG TPA: SPW repeat protein [Allosphingosinicella sp.]|nr:SPW repeat protein [Allosphingosinicella sp.]
MNRLHSSDWFGPALLGIGLLLIASPWMLGYHSDYAPTATAWGMGALFFLLGGIGLLGWRSWAEAGALTAGAWAALAPVILGFFHNEAAAAAHLAAGVAAVALLALEADRTRQDPPEMRV